MKQINHRIEQVTDWSGKLNCSKYKIIPQQYQQGSLRRNEPDAQANE